MELHYTATKHFVGSLRGLREDGAGLVHEKTLLVELGPILAAVRNWLGVELHASFFMENDASGTA